VIIEYLMIESRTHILEVEYRNYVLMISLSRNLFNINLVDLSCKEYNILNNERTNILDCIFEK
jgi:hypothetical protein